MAIHNALIAVDFDGTVVTHAYPEIGDDAGAVAVLKELTNRICIAEDDEIRGKMAIFVIPGRFRNRFSDHGTDSVRTATIE